MSLDGLALAAITDHLNETLVNGRIDKIYQPEKDEVVLSVRLPGHTLRLLISAHPQKARAHLVTAQKPNPSTPPMFCMVLRKHLEGGRILKFNQPSLERILEVHVENYDELGRLNTKVLIGEFMGKYSNLILIEPNSNTILDGIKRYSFASSQYREILPGRPYSYPPTQDKVDPGQILKDEESFKELLWKKSTEIPDLEVNRLILDTFLGLSPQTSREIVARANLPYEIQVGSLGEYELQQLWQGFKEVTNALDTGKWKPTLVSTQKGKVLAFAPIDLVQYNDQRIFHGNMSEVVDYYYSTKETNDRLQQAKAGLLTVIKENLNRLFKKLEIYSKDLKQAKNKEELKIMGELLTANLYQLKKGQNEVEVINYYDPEGKSLVITLDPQLNPSENAQSFYRRYNKAKSTEEMVLKLRETAEREISYLESVQTSINLATTVEELTEIREELISEEYLKKPIEKHNKKQVKEKKMISKPLMFVSSDNFEIFVGRNNKQNDYVTLRMAQAEDFWFHTKDIPGSHVILRTKGLEASPEAIELAANLAAYFSKARESSNVPVDYTKKKNVHKPSGAKPGMVIYEGQRTIYVTPDEKVIENYIS